MIGGGGTWAVSCDLEPRLDCPTWKPATCFLVLLVQAVSGSQKAAEVTCGG